MRETIQSVDPTDPSDPVAPVNVSKDIAVGRKILAWARQTLQEEEGHAAHRGTFRQTERPQRYLCYTAVMSYIIDFEPYFL